MITEQYYAKCVMEKGTLANGTFEKSKFPKFNSVLEKGDHVIAITHKWFYTVSSETNQREFLLAEDTSNNFEYRPILFACLDFHDDCYTELYKISEDSLANCIVYID